MEAPASVNSPAGPPRLFAGIDWGGSHHQVCVLDAEGRHLLQVRVTHDVAGLGVLDRRLAALGPLPVALERAEGLLVEHLQSRGHAVFAVNPRIAARARERYRVASVQDDVFDAFVLADALRHEHGHWRAARALAAAGGAAGADARSRPAAADPAAHRGAAARDPRGVPPRAGTAVQLRRSRHHPRLHRRLPDARRRRRRRAADGPFLRRQRYTGRVAPDVLAARLRASGAAGTVGGKAHSALVFAELLGLLNRQLADYDDAIELALDRHPDGASSAASPASGC